MKLIRIIVTMSIAITLGCNGRAENLATVGFSRSSDLEEAALSTESEWTVFGVVPVGRGTAVNASFEHSGDGGMSIQLGGWWSCWMIVNDAQNLGVML